MLVVLVGMVGGILVAVQASLAGILSDRLGLIENAFIVFGVGFLFSLVLLILFGGGSIKNWRSIPWYVYLAGPLGVGIITVIGFSIPRIGVATTLTLIIAAGAEHIDMYAETFDACAEGEVICYGAYNDYSEYYPTTALASFVVKWDTAIIWALEEWVSAVSGDGFDAPEAPTFTMSSDGSCDVKLADELSSTLSAEALDAFNQTRDAILDGTLVIEFDDTLPESD